MPLSWKWRLALAVLGVVLWSHPGSAAKIERFKDSEGTLHISNSGEAEPAKPGEAVTPRVTPVAPPPAAVPPAPPPAPVPPAPSPPPQMEPPAPAEVPEGAPPIPEGEPPAQPPGDQSAVGRPAPMLLPLRVARPPGRCGRTAPGPVWGQVLKRGRI